MEKTATNFFIPIAVGLLALCCVFIFYRQLYLEHKNDVKRDCEQTMLALRKDIHNHFLYRKLALERMANRLGFEDTDIAQWKKDALHYVQDQPGLKTIVWTDIDFRVLQEVAIEKDQSIIAQIVSYNKKLLEQQIILNVSGERNGILTFCVTVPGDRGYICALIDFAKFLQTCLRLHEHYALQIWSEEKVIYHANKIDEDNAYFLELRLENIPLKMQLSLIAKNRNRSFLAIVFLIFGVLTSVLFGYLTYISQKLQHNNVILQNQTNFFESVLSNMAEGVSIADKDGNFILRNASARSMTRAIQRKKVKEEDWSQEYGCFLPNKVDPFPNDQIPLLRALRGENVDGVEMYVKGPKMEEGAFLSVNARCIRNANNEITHGVVVFRDVTYIHNLLKSNEALDDFTHIVSHDLKEPLRGISSNSRFLLEDYEDLLDDEGKKRLRRLVFLTAHLQKLIEELLYFSRLGREKLSVQKNDLREIAESAKETFELSNGEVIDIDENLPVLPCNSAQMNKVFFNLMNNGLKYNTSIPKKIKIGVNKEQGQYIFYVRDNGIGIEPEFHDAVFQMFKRLNSEKEFGEGSGAGLAFVKKIIEKHNGEIWLESEQNVGTTVFFTLNVREN